MPKKEMPDIKKSIPNFENKECYTFRGILHGLPYPLSQIDMGNKITRNVYLTTPVCGNLDFYFEQSLKGDKGHISFLVRVVEHHLIQKTTTSKTYLIENIIREYNEARIADEGIYGEFYANLEIECTPFDREILLEKKDNKAKVERNLETDRLDDPGTSTVYAGKFRVE